MIYLDNNSTTQPYPEVINAMLPYYSKKWYNPSSSYGVGRRIAQDIEDARTFFAKSINAKSPEEIYFVSCGSEANNWALRNLEIPNIFIITNKIEHHSVLNAIHHQGGKYYEFHYVNLDTRKGVIDLEDMKTCVQDAATHSEQNVLVSTMWINNELGTIQPIEDIGKITKDNKCYFHVDAVQAFGKIPIDVQENNIDMLSVSSHKIGAPRGSGFLYIRQGIPLKPLIYGGQQENYMRAGTENVAGIMGFKKAAEITLNNMDKNFRSLDLLHEYFTRLLDKMGLTIINRDMPHFPSTLSVDCGVPAEALQAYLDQFNIAVSSGSACNSKDNKPSHVLTALGISAEQAGHVIRFSMSPELTLDQIDYVAEVLKRGIGVIKI